MSLLLKKGVQISGKQGIIQTGIGIFFQESQWVNSTCRSRLLRFIWRPPDTRMPRHTCYRVALFAILPAQRASLASCGVPLLSLAEMPINFLINH
jgi:hypothetical protein